MQKGQAANERPQKLLLSGSVCVLADEAGAKAGRSGVGVKLCIVTVEQGSQRTV